MPVIISTFWEYKFFGSKFEEKTFGRKRRDGVTKHSWWNTDLESLDQVMAEIVSECDEKQLKIKAVLPLTDSLAQSYNYGNISGFGHGWGVSNIVGVVMLMQREEQVNEAEYETRLKEVKSEKRSYRLSGNK